MALAVVQSCGPNGLFGSNVTLGNTVFMIGIAYNGGNLIGSSAPTLSGTAVPSGVLLQGQNSPTPTSALVYGGVWMLPALSQTGTQLGMTFSATGGATQQTLYGYEVSGLGSGPALDKSVFDNGSASGPAISGTTPAIAYSPEFVIGWDVGYALSMAGPTTGGWTTQVGNSSFTYAGYQIATSPGGTYSWSDAYSGSGNWVAGIVTVSPAQVAAAIGRSLVRNQAVKRSYFY